MNNLGIRVQPNKITFAIFNSETEEIINVETIVVPKALEIPEQLKFIRNSVLDLLREYKITRAGIKVTENNSQSLSIERLYIEGVIQETFASSSIEKYRTFVLSNMVKQFNTNATKIKRYLKNEEDDIGIAFDLSIFKKTEEKESILSAMAVSR